MVSREPTDRASRYQSSLRTIIPKFTEEMSQRNMVCVNLKDVSRAWPNASDPPEPAEKRQKVTFDFLPTKPLTPQSREKEQTESSAAGGSNAIQGSEVRPVVWRYKSLPRRS